MRILVQDFCGASYEIELTRELARRGHRALHLYFADNLSTPKGEIKAGERDSANFSIEGLHVPVEFSKHSIRTRRKADIAYGNAVAAKVAEFKPDVVISANMPLDAQAILQKAAERHQAKFVFWMTDVYCHAVKFVLQKKLGPLAGLVAAYYRRLETRLLQKSNGVVCISPGFKKIMTTWGIDPSRVTVIENWAPLNEVLPTPKDNPWAREHGLDRRFTFMYSGTLGMKHRPELLLALARHLETRGDAHLVVIAGGAGADWLRANAQDVRKDVLSILPFQPYERISEVLGTADVLIALLDSEAGSFAVPSKIDSYLCAGRSVIVAAPRDNHVTVVIERAQAGMVISPDSATDLVNAAKGLMENAELRARYAANARAYAEQSFDITKIADRFLEVFSGG